VGFFGRLEEMPLDDIVQILAMSRRTGKLSLTSGPIKAAIAFREGNIVCAASDRGREALGHILTSRGLITEETLNQAVTVQQRWMPWRLLGSLLVEMGAITHEQLSAVVRDQIEQVVGELLAWDSGLFKFESWTDEQGLVEEFEGAHLVFSEGVRTEQTMLQAAKRLDEEKARRRGEPTRQPLIFPTAEDRGRSIPADAASPATDGQVALMPVIDPENNSDEVKARMAAEPVVSSEFEVLQKLLELGGPGRRAGLRTGRLAPGDPNQVAEIALVKSIMDEIRSPRFTGEISLMIMRYAAEILRRGVLFAVRPGNVGVLGEFGFEHQDPEARKMFRGALIPLGGAAALRPAIELARAQRGGSMEGPANDALVELLNGGSPTEYVTVPMIVGGEAVAVLYGDNWPDGKEIGSIEGLELLVIHAGLCLERNRLESRLTAE
jgi:hypothetical protein